MKVPSPLPIRTVTYEGPDRLLSATTRSILPSPFEIAGRQPVRPRAGREVHGRGVGRRAGRQEDRHLALGVGDGDVGPAVAVEVGNHGVARLVADREYDLALKRAVAVAVEDRDRAGVEVRHHQVEVAVAGEVGRRDVRRLDPRVQRLSGHEGAVADAQQDRDAVIDAVR